MLRFKSPLTPLLSPVHGGHDYSSSAPELKVMMYSRNESVSDELLGEAAIGSQELGELMARGIGTVALYDVQTPQSAGFVELSVSPGV
jgi:hypothetical protein